MGCYRISFVEHLLNPGDLVRMPSLKKMDGMKLNSTKLNCFLSTQMGFLDSLKNKNIRFNAKPFSKRKHTIKDVQNSQKNLVDFHIEVNKKIDDIIDEKDIKEFKPVPRSELDQVLENIVEIRSPWNKNLEFFEFNPDIQRSEEWIEPENEKDDFNSTLFNEKEIKSVEAFGRIRVRSKKERQRSNENNNGFTQTKKELERTKEELEKRKKELEEIERIAKEKEEDLKRKSEEKNKREKERKAEQKKKEKEQKRKQKEIEKKKKLELKRYLKEQKLKEKEALKEKLQLEKEKKKKEKLREIERLELEKKNKKLKKLEAKRLLEEKKLKEKEEELKRKAEEKKETKKQEKKPILHFKEEKKDVKVEKQESDKNWDEEVRQAFTIIDDLLENLPEEKINEFINSEDFEIYERVVGRYKKKRE